MLFVVEFGKLGIRLDFSLPTSISKISQQVKSSHQLSGNLVYHVRCDPPSPYLQLFDANH